MVSFFDIGPDATRVGVVSFDNNVFREIYFRETSTKEELLSRINSILYNGGTTWTHAALNEARLQFASNSSGVRPVSEGVPKVVVLLTDGVSTFQQDTIDAGQKLKDTNVAVFSIGAGDVDDTELKAVASEPVASHYVKLADVSDVGEIASRMASFSCNEPAVINPGEEVTVDVDDGDFRYFTPVRHLLSGTRVHPSL